MSLVKCEHCNTRINPRQLDLHLKRCLPYRRKQKAGLIDAVEEKKDEAQLKQGIPVKGKKSKRSKKAKKSKSAKQA